MTARSLAFNASRLVWGGATALTFALLLAGCNPSPSTGNADTNGNAPKMADSSTGAGAGGDSKLVIEGSDTLLPLAQKWAEDFKKENPSVNLTVTGGGSGNGINSLLNGTADIADASRQAKDKEKAAAKEKGWEMNETPVARDGITIVVNPKNPVKSLTLAQLADIYTGKTKNWKEIGGADTPIVPSGRDTASGTYAYFQEDVLNKEKYRADMISTPSNNAIAGNVAAQPGGIGYIGVAYAKEFTQAGKVKEVGISFKTGDAPVLPTEDTILSGTYPISRALYNYTHGTPTGLAKKYLDYVTGPEGQKVVVAQGYVPLTKDASSAAK